MSLTNIVEGYDITSMTLSEKKITSINFYHGDSNYHAEIGVDSIKLSDRDTGMDIAEFDKGKVWWYLSHSCKPEVKDAVFVCQACMDPKVKENFWNSGVLKFYGRGYSRELSNVLSKGIYNYMSRFHDFCGY